MSARESKRIRRVSKRFNNTIVKPYRPTYYGVSMDCSSVLRTVGNRVFSIHTYSAALYFTLSLASLSLSLSLPLSLSLSLPPSLSLSPSFSVLLNDQLCQLNLRVNLLVSFFSCAFFFCSFFFSFLFRFVSFRFVSVLFLFFLHACPSGFGVAPVKTREQHTHTHTRTHTHTHTQVDRVACSFHVRSYARGDSPHVWCV